MPRKTMTVDVLSTDNDRATITIVGSGQKWTSVDGDWLKIEEGVWVEVAGTISLKNPAGAKVVVTLFDCSFDTSSVGATGRANFNEAGKNGSWLVTGVT